MKDMTTAREPASTGERERTRRSLLIGGAVWLLVGVFWMSKLIKVKV